MLLKLIFHRPWSNANAVATIFDDFDKTFGQKNYHFLKNKCREQFGHKTAVSELNSPILLQAVLQKNDLKL
jgi:hypothetical protein